MHDDATGIVDNDGPVATGIGSALSQSRKLRLFAVFILYVAQGVPIGLFWFAIPAWMAANGAGAGDVAYVLGLTALPWSLKLVNGFFMDRYTFLAMGRRPGSRKNGHSSNRDRREPKQRAPERHHCIEHETRNQAGYRA